jgi:Ser/Thr protein kinase RdoA (MazF antagonist)
MFDLQQRITSIKAVTANRNSPMELRLVERKHIALTEARSYAQQSGLASVTELCTVPGGLLNTNFLCTHEDGVRTLLRVYPAERALGEVQFEWSILRRLQEVAFPAPRVLSPSPFSVDQQLAGFFSFIPGRALTEDDLDVWIATAAGDLLRRFHDALRGFLPSGVKERHDVTHIDGLIRDGCRSLPSAWADELARRYETDAKELLCSGEWDDLPLGVVHADYYCSNLIVDDHGRLAGLIDFDDAYHGTQFFDVAIGAMEFAAEENQTLDVERLSGFLRGYGIRLDQPTSYRLVDAMRLNCYRFLCYTLALSVQMGEHFGENRYALRAANLLKQRTALANELYVGRPVAPN